MNRLYREGNDNIFACYIKNNLTGTKIQFPVLPQAVSESVSSSFTQQEIVGASVPRIIYASTGAKIISFSLQNLSEDYVASGFSNLLQYVRALEALAYPTYSNTGVVNSPDLTLVLGDRSIQCVCTNVSVTWNSFVREQRMLSCNVELSLLVTRYDVPGATIIEANG